MDDSDGTSSRSLRTLEETVRTDFRTAMSSGDHLSLDRLLTSQNPLSECAPDLTFFPELYAVRSEIGN